jgi:hypothetical protein
MRFSSTNLQILCRKGLKGMLSSGDPSPIRKQLEERLRQGRSRFRFSSEVSGLPGSGPDEVKAGSRQMQNKSVMGTGSSLSFPEYT